MVDNAHACSVNYFLRLFKRASEIQKVNWHFLNESIQTRFGQHKVLPQWQIAISDTVYSPQKYDLILSICNMKYMYINVIH